MKIIFFGSSEFSLAALKACLESEHQVELVITTPDQKKGRGLKIQPTPVRQFCIDRHIPVEAYETLKNPEALEKARSLKPELFVVSSYGKFILSSWLALPSHLALNVHPSLLPKYRGASPLNFPILKGDKETGVSIAEVTSKLDAGDIFYQERFSLSGDMDAHVLMQRLAELSAGCLQKVFHQIKQGSLHRVPQVEAASCYARKLAKEDGLLSFYMTAHEMDCRIRGLKPWPGTYLLFQNEHLRVLKGKFLEESVAKKPGTLLGIEKDGSIKVSTGKGIFQMMQVQPAGKKPMSASDFAHGRRLTPGFEFEPQAVSGTVSF